MSWDGDSRFPVPSDVPDDRAVVVHAAGAVVLTTPASWDVREVPVGREVRLEIGPPAATPDKRPSGQLWLTYHFRSTPPGDEAAVASFAASRTENLARRLRCSAGPPTWVTVGGSRALLHQLAFSPRDDAADQRAGVLLVASAPAGYCEICSIWPSADGRLRAELDGVITSLRLRSPREIPGPGLAETQDAAAILGSWKSYRGRLRLYGDGRVAIASDAPFRSADGAGDEQQGREVWGDFLARQDLLLITWADGSRLNFRWSQRDDRLLLTDHEGHMTQLRRILE
jgi:hypothetical protein